jgi:hypothetical protein
MGRGLGCGRSALLEKKRLQHVCSRLYASLCARATYGLLPQALVQPVDQIRHRLEALGDHAEPVLTEVLGLDA